MDHTFTINGDFNITNTGSSTWTIPSTTTLTVNGDVGDPTNNNVDFVVINGAND